MLKGRHPEGLFLNFLHLPQPFFQRCQVFDFLGFIVLRRIENTSDRCFRLPGCRFLSLCFLARFRAGHCADIIIQVKKQYLLIAAPPDDCGHTVGASFLPVKQAVEYPAEGGRPKLPAAAPVRAPLHSIRMVRGTLAYGNHPFHRVEQDLHIFAVDRNRAFRIAVELPDAGGIEQHGIFIEPDDRLKGM